MYLRIPLCVCWSIEPLTAKSAPALEIPTRDARSSAHAINTPNRLPSIDDREAETERAELCASERHTHTHTARSSCERVIKTLNPHKTSNGTHTQARGERAWHGHSIQTTAARRAVRALCVRDRVAWVTAAHNDHHTCVLSAHALTYIRVRRHHGIIVIRAGCVATAWCSPCGMLIISHTQNKKRSRASSLGYLFIMMLWWRIPFSIARRQSESLRTLIGTEKG